MKEVTLKFESEEDYKKFIDGIIVLSVEEDRVEFDSANDIIIINKQLINN